ncbi:MAG: SDR family oxidoreductase [bacterium]|nr:SDR family oxidoreductase [bacterium]
MTQSTQFDLSEKTVLITGGAGFLGRHFARALAAAGARVAVGDVDEKRALAAAGEIGAGASGLLMDVTDKKSIEAAVQQAAKETGRLDVLVNNAAIDAKFETGAQPNDKLFENYPEEMLRGSLDVNLLGYVLCAQAAAKKMLEQSGGNIINVSSIYGVVGPDQRIYPAGTQKPVDYAITKGGVLMLTKWLATTYGARGIRANSYTLGGVFNGHDDEFARKYSERVPLGRMVDPEDIGAPLVFLASEASSGMTGHNLVVDGGLTAW